MYVHVTMIQIGEMGELSRVLTRLGALLDPLSAAEFYFGQGTWEDWHLNITYRVWYPISGSAVDAIYGSWNHGSNTKPIYDTIDGQVK